MNCDQCHLDSGVKTKSKKVFSLAKVHEATYKVTIAGCVLKLCDIHKRKLELACEKKETKCSSVEI